MTRKIGTILGIAVALAIGVAVFLAVRMFRKRDKPSTDGKVRGDDVNPNAPENVPNRYDPPVNRLGGTAGKVDALLSKGFGYWDKASGILSRARVSKLDAAKASASGSVDASAGEVA